MIFIDSHCHFDFSQFDLDRKRVWQNCLESDVRCLLIPGVAPAQWPRAKEISDEIHGVFYSAGLHPWWLKNYCNNYASVQVACDALKEALEHVLQDPSCLAVGECGLDKLIDTPIDVQIKFLHIQMALSKSYKKPLILHSRKTHSELLHELKQGNVQKAIVHGFTGSAELAEQYWKQGVSLGVGGSITYPRANKTREAIKALPLEALVLETDAPNMPLKGMQGKRNNPYYIPEVAKALSELRGESLEEIAHQTTINAMNFYGLDKETLFQ